MMEKKQSITSNLLREWLEKRKHWLDAASVKGIEDAIEDMIRQERYEARIQGNCSWEEWERRKNNAC